MVFKQPENPEKKPILFTKIRIIKNLFVVAFSFFLIFTACQGLNLLQSTLNKKEGIGVAGQGVIYVGFCISSLLFPNYLIKKFGCKVCLLLGMVSFIPYIVANFSPAWGTIVSSAVLLGAGAAILWGTLCTYINLLSALYCECPKNTKSENSSDNPNTKKNIVFQLKNTLHETLKISKEALHNNEPGVSNLTRKFDEQQKSESNFSENDKNTNYACQLNSKQWPTIISEDNKQENFTCAMDVDIPLPSNLKRPRTLTNCSLVEIQRVSKIESINARFFGFHGLMYHSAMIFSNLLSYFMLSNSRHNQTEYLRNSTCACGPMYCDQQLHCENDEVMGISPETRYTLVTISAIIGTAGVLLILFFLDDLRSQKENVSLSFDLLLSTLVHSKKKEQLSLIGLTLYYGLTEGFFVGDFTKSYVGCALGPHYIGIVAFVFGIGSASSSTLSGILVKYIGRLPIFLSAQVINLGFNSWLLLWTPDSESMASFFIIAIAWGIFTGTIWSQLKAFYGTIFKGNEEVAFANYFVWTSVGYILSFSYSHYLCAYIKIYIMIVVSCVGFVGYTYAEWMLYKRKENE